MRKSDALITQHRWLRIRSAERHTTIPDFVIMLRDREPSGDGGANRNRVRPEEQDG
jgi:hypothetical protein